MPTQLTDCCALPFLRFAKINPMPSVPSFWLQPPVAPAIQLLAPEIEIQDRMQMAGAPVFTWMLPTASAGGFFDNIVLGGTGRARGRGWLATPLALDVQPGTWSVTDSCRSHCDFLALREPIPTG